MMKNRRYALLSLAFIVITLCSCDSSSNPESNDVPGTSDSMVNVIRIDKANKSPQEYPEVKRYAEKGWALIKKGELDSAVLCFEQALELPSPENIKAMIYNDLGDCYKRKNDFPSALNCLLKAIELNLSSGDTIMAYRYSVNTLNCFSYLGLHERAFQYGLKAESILTRDSNDRRTLAVLYNALGTLYSDIKQYDRAILYHNKSLEIRSDNTLGMSVAPSLNNLGTCYLNQGNAPKALDHFLRYRDMALSKPNSLLLLGRAYINLGRTYTYMSKYDSAETCFSRALDISTKNKDSLSLMFLHLHQADEHYPVAQRIAHGEKALELSRRLNIPTKELNATEILESAYLENGQCEDAYVMSLERARLSDTIKATQQLGRIYDLELEQRQQQTQHQITQLEQEKRIAREQEKVQRSRFIFVVFFCALLCALLYLLYRQYLNKKRFVTDYFASNNTLILKTGKQLAFEDIERVESLRNDLIIETRDGQIKEKNTTLGTFYESLPKIQFGRPQRGIVLNFSSIENVKKTKLDYKNLSINISPTYREEFLKRWEIFETSRQP